MTKRKLTKGTIRIIQAIILIIVASQVRSFGQESNNTEFRIIEKTATFPGGMNKFYEHIYSNLKYPKDISKKKSIGTVYIEFVIKEDGYIDKDSIRAIPISELEKTLPPRPDGTRASIKDMPESCKQEAIRAILTSPRWNPGTTKGVPQRQKFVIPVKFGR